MENLFVSLSTLPLFLIFTYILKVKGILKKGMPDSLGFVGFNLGLSSLIFLSFLKAPINGSDLLNPLLGFGFSSAIFVAGLVLVKLFKIAKSNRAIFVSSIVTREGGSIGYPFFWAIFGVENLSKIALFDLGMATFAFTCLTYYFYRQTGIRDLSGKKQLMEIIKIPILPAMIVGLTLNLLKINIDPSTIIGGSILRFLEALSAIAVPLILMSLIINLKINIDSIRKTLSFSFVSIAIAIAVAIGFLFFWNIVPLNNLTKGALFIMAFLPPSFYPFILSERLNLSDEQKDYAARLFSVTVFVSIIFLLLFSSIIARAVAIN